MKKFNIYMITIIFLVLDQLTKVIISSTMQVNSSISILSNFFKIYYLQNEGAAFSSLIGMRIVLIIISVIAFFTTAEYIKKKNNISKPEGILLGIFLGGLLGNLMDRLIYGYVIDFLSFTIFGFSFAVFNIADIGIVLGIGGLIIEMIRREKSGTKR